jgi:Ribbon-helix-helix protein, copG family
MTQPNRPRSQREQNGRRDSTGKLYVTIRMPPDLMERIDAECGSRMVSRTYVFEKAMLDWLEQHEGAAS